MSRSNLTPSSFSAAPSRPLDTPEALLAAAARQGLILTTRRTALDGTGLDFLVLHAEDEAGTPWIVRAPRRAALLETARREARVLALVSEHLPVAVPDWRVFSEEIIAYPRLSGTPAVTLEDGAHRWNHLDPAHPSDVFLESFARALHALQAIPPALVEAAGIPRQDGAAARAAFREHVELTREALQPSEAMLTRWQRWLQNDALWPARVALVHGDLHPGHLLLDAGGHLQGILDWTEAKLTEPSVDLAMFFGCFGQAALERLAERLRALGTPLEPSLLEHARERWFAGAVTAAEWALRNGNEAALEYARQHLRQTSGDAAP